MPFILNVLRNSNLQVDELLTDYRTPKTQPLWKYLLQSVSLNSSTTKRLGAGTRQLRRAGDGLPAGPLHRQGPPLVLRRLSAGPPPCHVLCTRPHPQTVTPSALRPRCPVTGSPTLPCDRVARHCTHRPTNMSDLPAAFCSRSV